MSSAFNQFGEYIFIALGIFCVFRGFIILTTGKLTEREEASLRDYTENGIRKYKMLSAVINIIGGVVVIGMSVVKILNLIDPNMLRIIVLAIVIVMIVIYVLVRNSCKNTK